MSAVFYYADSINTRSPSYAYPCASYSDFEKGLCTSCGPDGSQCQRAGYHASPDGTLGALYLMTLSGVKPPHFGMKQNLQKEILNGIFLFSRFSFRSDTCFSYAQTTTSTRHL